MHQIKIMQSVTARTMTVDKYLKDINAIKMVSPDEEIELAERISAGDEAAFQRLVEANLRFVVSVAKQFQGGNMELCDLINEGNIGLMVAARRFDPTRGFKFISYAVWWIRQQIMSAVSEQARMVRLPQSQVGILNKINKTKAKFLQENEREPSNEELADFLDLTPDKIEETLRVSASHMSFDTPFGDEGDGTLLDVVPDKSAELADSAVNQESLAGDLQTVMLILTPREREIITYAFGLGGQEMSLEEIGEMMDLSRERIRQLKDKAVRKMARSKARERLIQYI